MRAAKSQSGVMLIEALIGILIFSIGILALIGMQATAMRNTTDARYRSEASFLATQIVGQMWVDRANLMLYTTAGHPPRDAWATQVSATLPGVGSPAPAPTISVGAGNEVTVTVYWRQPGESQDRKVTLINRINGS
jgi:type IV pilus assembly protein PilV